MIQKILSSPSVSASPTDSLLSGAPLAKRECLMCGDKEVTGALVPCGHNMFCLECANRICAPGDALCPVCSQAVSCKIKALRAKTNTYIKTPVRGEEPVFVVTGRKEDVAKAKREILSAAEHFSLIRASRKPSAAVVGAKGTPLGPAINIPGHVTIQVRVPYRVVGLVVGPKGATIKHIQQQTHTYIVTPSRDKEPVFEVTGLPDSVQAARHQIEAHIALRTGQTNGLGGLLGDDPAPELLASLYKNGLGSLFGYLEGQSVQEASASTSSAASTASSKSGPVTRPELINIWKNLSSGESIDFDEGLGDSPSIWSMQPSSLLESR
uniref:Uncharacterized protein n=1 Tax=Phlebotomus papatasi TaxID=29031 RepID=A0A1B0DG86_PHLPP